MFSTLQKTNCNFVTQNVMAKYSNLPQLINASSHFFMCVSSNCWEGPIAMVILVTGVHHVCDLST